MTAPTHARALAEAISQRCEDARLYRDGWRARCPAHQGTSDNSLAITPADGRVLLYCHAGCTFEDILGALRMSPSELFIQPSRNGQAKIVGLFDYRDTEGTLQFQVVRKEPKAFYQRRPDPVHPERWIPNLNGVQTILYRLPELAAAVATGKTIYIPEGEKHVDRLYTLGLAATCNPMGAGKWKDTYSEALRGATVVVLPDNDSPGRQHGEQVARSLHGIAASIKVVDLPNLPDKGDVLDWLAAGGTREQLEGIVEEAPLWQNGLKRSNAYLNPNGAGPEPTDIFACPELPAYAKTDAERAAEASLWLDDYIAFSRAWAPRAYDGFHEACGLFILATAAARRVKVAFGPQGVYTSLYQALASRTSLYTKTTAGDLAIEFLSRAGLRFLLANDDATPQAFLRSLTLYVSDDYDNLSEDEQHEGRNALAFAAQKGWFYEEWGQHLAAMMQKDGLMASFRSILRRLDDHKPRFTYETISRGKNTLIKPYITLLANVTPADLQPFIKPGSPLWRDGYIARMAFVAPGDTPPSDAAFPKGTPQYPASLIHELAQWHQRLGLPSVAVELLYDKKQRETGKYKASLTRGLPEQTYTLHDAVWKAYYAYDQAMRELLTARKDENLDGSYARFPAKALRIAGLLASLHDTSNDKTIHLRHWHRGQAIAERWRRDLHALMRQMHGDVQPSRQREAEDRIVSLLRKHSAMSINDLRRCSRMSSAEISETCRGLVEAHVLSRRETGRTVKYTLNGAAGDL